MVDPNGGSGQWLWTIVASNLDLRYSTITDNNPSIHVTLINAAKTFILMMFSFTLDIYCTSVRPGRGIPHMWLSLRFLRSFYPVKSGFSSFSLLLLRVKGRGCHTLLKPYETNCDLWIWAIQIKFDWLIDTWFVCWLPGRGVGGRRSFCYIPRLEVALLKLEYLVYWPGTAIDEYLQGL